MIDLMTYRSRIGCYNNSGRGRGKREDNYVINRSLPALDFSLGKYCYESVWSIAIASVGYCYCLLLLCTIALLQIIPDVVDAGSFTKRVQLEDNMSNIPGVLPFLCTSYVKIAYFSLISTVILRYRGSFFLVKKPVKRSARVLQYLISSILLINFLLIGIVNPSMLNPGPESISVSYQNVQGLIPFSQLGKTQPKLDCTKIYELNCHLSDKSPDVLVLNETWLSKSIQDREVIKHLNYDVYRNDRSQVTHPTDPNNPTKYRKFGGGVLIAVRSNIDAEVKRISMRKGAEILAIELAIGNNKYVFCTIYRVGTLAEDNHESIVQSLKSLYTGRNLRKVFILGDLNLNSITWPLNNEHQADATRIDKLFLESFSELGLEQYVLQQTHTKGKTLDIVLSNVGSLINELRVDKLNPIICKSDHYPIFFKVKANIKNKQEAKRRVYNFKKANWGQLNEDISRVPWRSLVDHTDPHCAWKNFKEVLFALVDKHIPKITIKNNFSAPWFDAECYEAYRSKERAHKKFKLNESIANEIKRDSARTTFKNLCDKKMRENLYNADDPALISKKFWSHVKSNSKSSRIPECMSLGSVFRNLPIDKANLFNNYFFDQFSDASSYEIDIDWSEDEDFSIDFNPLRIRDCLLAINPNKACGPDGIHGRVLKNCAASLAKPLSMIFQLSYNCGSLPKDWKLANVVPVHKKGSKSCVENYRPISLTSLVMKTFERILKEELLMRTAHLLDVRQHGFLNNRSCTTNMVDFLDGVVLSINDCNTFSTDVVYFDFSKAFDSVNHDLILNKLKNMYGIDGRLLKFIMNYLQGREQSVIIDNCVSTSKPVLSGVPQGSIIGPILFVLFINDLSDGLSPGTGLALYADDTKIWRSIQSDLDHDILQSDISKLNNWALENKMKFHPAKCKVISICNKPSPLDMLPSVQFHYRLGDCLLDYAENEKDLGVTINKKLNFGDHCELILSKANQQFGLLVRTCHFVKDTLRRRVLYLALVRSQFEHCSQIWRPHSKTLLDRFENFQKKCIKWILSECELSYSCSDTYTHKCRQVNILPLKLRFVQNDLVFFYKILYGLVPIKLPEYLQWFRGSTRLRNSHLDHLSLTSSILPSMGKQKLLDKSFFYRTHCLWNSLPLEIREQTSLSGFKAKLESHLWDLSTVNDDPDPNFSI